MSLNQSNLSSTPLDFVVAVSEESVNSTMFQYMSQNSFPAMSLCWTQVENGPLIPITLAALMAGNASQGGTNGTNPFDVPNWTNGEPMSQDLTNINNSAFACGIQLQIGIPAGMNIPGAPNQPYTNTLPYMVSLNTTNSNTAIFNLLFAQFTVVYPTFGRSGLSAYNNDSQPSGSSWGITVNVPLSQITVSPSSAPSNVQQALSKMGPGAFSIQQLFFDFLNATITDAPTQNWPAIVSNQFTVAMLEQLIQQNEQSQGLASVGYTITAGAVQPSTFNIGNLEMVFEEYEPSTESTQMLNTVNYLCTVPGGNRIPPNYSGISWNWFDTAAQLGTFDGVVAINRNTLAAWIYSQISNNVMQNCFAPYVRVWLSGFIDMTVNWQWNLTPWQTPTVTYPATGSTVLSVNYSSSASDQAGLNGDMGGMKLAPSYSANVSFENNTIIIVQNLTIYLWVSSLSTSAGGNVVDITITDTYTLGVNATGQISASLSSSTSNTSESPSRNGFLNFFTDINDIINSINSWIQNFTATSITDIPVSDFNSFVFPGSQTFTYSNVAFSNNQDMVSCIVYDDPAGAATEAKTVKLYSTENFSHAVLNTNPEETAQTAKNG